MAYGFKYLFRFLSQNGDTFQIQVEKEGYSGDIIKRSLGAPPKWKRERNGHICGSSIEFRENLARDYFQRKYGGDRIIRCKFFNETLNRVFMT